MGVKFGRTLSGEYGAFVASAGVEANFKVMLTRKRTDHLRITQGEVAVAYMAYLAFDLLSQPEGGSGSWRYCFMPAMRLQRWASSS